MSQRHVSTRSGAAMHRTGSTYATLSREVRAAGLLDRTLTYYWTLFGVLLCALAGLLALMVLLGDSWWQLGLAAALGVVLTQFGFLGHDAAHRQVFRTASWNDWAARVLAGAFTGLSLGWWRSKHNRHHAAPNHEGRDPDIGTGALVFTPSAAEARAGGAAAWCVRHQGWLFFPLLTLEGINLHVASVRALSRGPRHAFRSTELGLVLVRLVSFAAGVFLLLPPVKALCFIAVQMAVFGLCLGGSFAPNHKGMPLVPPTSSLDFLHRQVLMSRNVRGGPVIDLMMGGLNYQIEHHLFPSMPRPHLRRAQPIVRAHCVRHGVPYTELGLLASYAVVIGYLNDVGLRARGPFECPLSAELRGGLPRVQ